LHSLRSGKAITLPFAMTGTCVESDGTGSNSPVEALTGLRVLVLENEMFIMVMIEDLLGDLGCRIVGPAATVADALALAEAGGIDAALLDLNLGYGETGYPVADLLAQRDVPFAFVTGYSADVLRPPHSGRPILEKPFWGESLGNVLRALLAPGRAVQPGTA
jgi:CheY-like chemotaxis protein